MLLQSPSLVFGDKRIDRAVAESFLSFKIGERCQSETSDSEDRQTGSVCASMSKRNTHLSRQPASKSCFMLLRKENQLFDVEAERIHWQEMHWQ